MHNIEVHSTPNGSQDNKIKPDITNEINSTDDSGIQITPKLNRESKINNEEVSFTDKNVAAQSTPTTTRAKELSMDDIFNLMKAMSENISSNLNELKEQNKEQKSDSDVKFHELKGDINNIDKKFDKRLCDMKQQSVKLEGNINKHLNEMDECVNTIKAVSYTHLDVYKRQIYNTVVM